MSQSKLGSAVEAWVNIAAGFGLSLLVWQTVGPSFGYNVTWHDNVQITTIFTGVSFVRSYALRRVFNWFHRS